MITDLNGMERMGSVPLDDAPTAHELAPDNAPAAPVFTPVLPARSAKLVLTMRASAFAIQKLLEALLPPLRHPFAQGIVLKTRVN